MARPLDKIVKDKRLVRDAKIEAEIDQALGQDLDMLRTRAAVHDEASPDYLHSETLVHLIRHSLRQSNSEPTYNQVANALLPFLLKRCEANLKSKVSSKIGTAETLRADILSEFGLLFVNELAPDGDHKLDFYEVRFNRAFRFFRIDAVRSELIRLNRISAPTPITPDDDSANDAIDMASFNPSDHGVDLDESIFKKQMSRRLRAAITELPEDQHKALILHYYYGIKIESEDPTQRTVATLCKTSGRTIRTRLARALATLSKLREVT